MTVELAAPQSFWMLAQTVPEAAPVPGDVVARASRHRSELRAGRAEIEQAEAEVRVMRSMYAPMAMVRMGPAYTMAEGEGWMVMIGVSIPLWRDKLRAGGAEADAMVDMATADLDAMRRMAEAEARSAGERVVAARARDRALRDDIVPRARPLWMAQRDLVVGRAELGIAWARLRRAASEEVVP